METGKTTQPIRKELSYDDKVIKKIAGIATDSVQGVLAMSDGLIGGIADSLRAGDKTKGIGAEVGKKQVALDISVVCEYGRNIPLLFDEVSEKIRGAVLAMTGLELVELNMHVSDVLNKEDFEKLRQKQLAGDADSDGGGIQQALDNAPIQSTRVQ